jgi:D-alanyl-lipoteichoic acid acyltransferase DltB (MBOAT superfamily)
LSTAVCSIIYEWPHLVKQHEEAVKAEANSVVSSRPVRARKLPINFDSPLKSKSIIEFWQRWHISLTKIIYEFIFIPISIKIHKIININNFFSEIIFKKFFPLIFTFLIIGMWHGGTLNFIIFGLLNGFLIFINYIWRDYVSVKYFKSLNNLSSIEMKIFFLFIVFLLAFYFIFVMYKNSILNSFK